jgi:flagellar protein FliO/FliZ
MRRWLVLLSIMVPHAAYAGEQPGAASGFSLVGGFLQMFASLAIVIGVILVAYHLFNRFLKGGLVKKQVPRHIRVVESRFLAPKKSLLLVEVGGEYLLLGSTGDDITLIKQIDMLETIEVVEELSPVTSPPVNLADVYRHLMELRNRIGGLLFPGKRATQ